MPPVYSVTVLNARLNAVITSLGNSATCQLYDSGNNTLVTMTIPSSVGSVSGGVLAFEVPWSANATAAGVPVSATIFATGGSPAITGLTVGTGVGSYDIVMASSAVVLHQAVAIVSATITGH